MDLSDFLNSMRQIQKMGPLEGILKMLPGVNTKALKQMKADPKRMKHVEAIVLSMTPEERKNPGIINGSRRARIAKGSGRPISDVNRLLDQPRLLLAGQFVAQAQISELAIVGAAAFGPAIGFVAPSG